MWIPTAFSDAADVSRALHRRGRRRPAGGALFFGARAPIAAQLNAPDTVIVAGFGALIVSLAQVSRSGNRPGSHPVLVYLGELSYSIYMICVPWQLLFVNLSVKVLHLTCKQLPW